MLNTWSFDVTLSRIRNCMLNVGGFNIPLRLALLSVSTFVIFIMEYIESA